MNPNYSLLDQLTPLAHDWTIVVRVIRVWFAEEEEEEDEEGHDGSFYNLLLMDRKVCKPETISLLLNM